MHTAHFNFITISRQHKKDVLVSVPCLFWGENGCVCSMFGWGLSKEFWGVVCSLVPPLPIALSNPSMPYHVSYRCHDNSNGKCLVDRDGCLLYNASYRPCNFIYHYSFGIPKIPISIPILILWILVFLAKNKMIHGSAELCFLSSWDFIYVNRLD